MLLLHIGLYLESGHTVYCCRGVLKLEPLLQQVAAICKIQEGVIILHAVTSFCQEEDENKIRRVEVRKIMRERWQSELIHSCVFGGAEG